MIAILLLQPIAIHAQVQPVILVLGDSLSAGYGINLDQGWVTQLQKRLQNEGYSHQVVNASVSGETTRGALTRVNDLLEKYQPKIIIIELGGNDGLRGISLKEVKENFSRIIEQSKKQNIQVLLVKMRIPPNYGPKYTEAFEALFPKLEKEYDISLAPFILKDIAIHPELIQEDGIHPKVEAQGIMLNNVWPALVPLLKNS
ncbi:arylesterase [Candidatus Nitrosacidococcus tergens]|uniref:Esterase TesA n=1 Tax=Candidatus Nitrosacidococcus tergens TaxID=553981 RepID=A0A7G1Q922_9GAMM|nr:arylesterase [Candidatus Nitrosacidococcus tergens]CAB1275084.1 Esterase TesA [Candidatus Nitrosacidococcus tergens]